MNKLLADEISPLHLRGRKLSQPGSRPVGDVEITLPNSQGNQSFRSVAGKRSSGRAVYLGDPRLALLGRSPVGAESRRSRRLAQSPQVLYFLGKCSGGIGAQIVEALLYKWGTVPMAPPAVIQSPAGRDRVESGRFKGMRSQPIDKTTIAWQI